MNRLQDQRVVWTDDFSVLLYASAQVAQRHDNVLELDWPQRSLYQHIPSQTDLLQCPDPRHPLAAKQHDGHINQVTGPEPHHQSIKHNDCIRVPVNTGKIVNDILLQDLLACRQRPVSCGNRQAVQPDPRRIHMSELDEYGIQNGPGQTAIVGFGLNAFLPYVRDGHKVPRSQAPFTSGVDAEGELLSPVRPVKAEAGPKSRVFARPV